MKKISLKSFVVGVVIGMFGLCTAFGASVIHSAQYRQTKITIDGTPLNLLNPLVAVVKENENDAKMYMPVREILESLGYRVEWDEETDTICIKSQVRVVDDTIIKNINWELGYPNYYIDIQEDLSTNAVWQCTSSNPEVISFVGDEYISKKNTTTNMRRFTFAVPRNFNQEEFQATKPKIIFEKMLDGKKTGSKIIYEINMNSSYDKKPVIYLYPKKKTDITVSLDYDGVLDYTYPKYNNGWSVTAYPDGKIINHTDNKEYSYLFWEGHNNANYDFSKGYVIKGEDTAEFLQNKLSEIGLTPKEYNEFIVYWLPYMQDNPYNFITFQENAYTDKAKLDIVPTPDSMLRVFMAFKPLENYVNVEPQVIKPFIRNGFTVVEWGGTMVGGQ